MAGRGRDLKVTILADVTSFDLDKPAEQLGELGDNAEKAAHPLDALLGKMNDAKPRSFADDTEKASREVKDLGDTADQTARDVDDLQRTIAAASQELRRLGDAGDTSRRDVDRIRRSTDDAGEGFREFKDEARASSFEAAQSFSGSSTDIVDSLQEIAGEALPALGPAAAAAGFAAAIGIGYLFNKSQVTKEQIQELTQSLVDDGGRLSRGTVFDRIAEKAAESDLSDMTRQAERLGIAATDLQAIFSGNSRDLDLLRDRIHSATDALGEQARRYKTASTNSEGYSAQLTAEQQSVLDRYEAGRKLLKQIDAQSGATREAARRAKAFKDITGESVESVQEFADAVDSTVDPLEAFKDRNHDGVKSVGEMNRALARQVKALENWAGNLQELSQRGVQDGVIEQLKKLGPEGAPLIAKLVNASDKELSRFARLMADRARLGSGGFNDALRRGGDQAVGTAGRTADEIAARLNRHFTPKITLDTSAAVSALNAFEAHLNAVQTRSYAPYRLRP